MTAPCPPEALTAAAQAIHDLIWVHNGHHLCKDDSQHADTVRQAYTEASAALDAALPYLTGETVVAHDLEWAKRTSRIVRHWHNEDKEVGHEHPGGGVPHTHAPDGSQVALSPGDLT